MATADIRCVQRAQPITCSVSDSGSERSFVPLLLSVAQQSKLSRRAGTPAPLELSSVFPVGRASVPGGRLPGTCLICATLNRSPGNRRDWARAQTQAPGCFLQALATGRDEAAQQAALLYGHSAPRRAKTPAVYSESHSDTTESSNSRIKQILQCNRHCRTPVGGVALVNGTRRPRHRPERRAWRGRPCSALAAARCSATGWRSSGS